MKLDEVDIEDLMHICQWILFHDKNLPFRDGEVTVNVVERAHAFSKLIDNNTCEKVRAGRRIMTIHEHRFIKDAFKSAQYACEWIQREAHWGCLPNMDSPRAETKEQDSTTMDAVDSAQDFLNYLKYDLKVLETSTNMLAQAKGDDS